MIIILQKNIKAVALRSENRMPQEIKRRNYGNQIIMNKQANKLEGSSISLIKQATATGLKTISARHIKKIKANLFNCLVND